MAIRCVKVLGVVLALFLLSCSACAVAEAETAVRSRTPLIDGWRFAKGDPEGVDDRLSYANLKPWMLASAAGEKLPDGEPGAGVSFVQREFDDSGWRQLDLPHDWGIEGPFDQALPGENAKLPYSGVAWYRKRFDVPASDTGSQLYLDVDGAMSFANVWLNGHFVGGWPYGYTSWRVDLTPYVRFGGENVLAVRLDNPDKSSRWYPGGGIYRNVWLVKTRPIHVAQWGVRVTTPSVTADAAEANVRVTVDNTTETRERVDVSVTVYELDAKGNRVGGQVGEHMPVLLEIDANRAASIDLPVKIRAPQFWSPERPTLYAAQVSVVHNEDLVDRIVQDFGVRTIAFTPDTGFELNGKPLEIRGVCLHHDLGALGAAFNLRARQRQLELLKEMGVNAIRASHNPLEPEFYELCDRMGFLVMDEAFDAWQMEKRPNDYHLLFDDWHEHDLRAMIRRDANHPSVIMWSLGNEIYEQREGKNAPLAKKLADIAHNEDPTRPVNMALHVIDASTNGFQNAVDVFGYNYTPFGYAEFRKNNPQIPLIGSETSSCTSTRGAYYFPVNEEDKRSGRSDFQVTSYDYSAPKWAMAPDIEFAGQDDNPFVGGEFVWTGFDYLGEPTPFDTDAEEMLVFTDKELEAKAAAEIAADKKIRVPSRSSYFGILDLCGFPKDRFYIYQARWRPELPMAHILPHWNWPERVGQATPVHVYTSGDEAELFLNGKSLGRKRRGPRDYRLRWNDVVYEPGELRVVAYRDGKEWATDVVQTTGAATKLALTVDRKQIANDGRDLAFLTATVTDAGNRLVPRSDNRLRFSLEGPGEIVVTDNGDATSHEPFQQNERAAFNGMALAVVRAKPGATGAITVRVEADGLEPAHVTFDVVARE